MTSTLARHLKSVMKKEGSKFVHAAGNKCRHCTRLLKAKTGAWGLCANHYRKARRKALKEALIAYKGGACEKCGGCFHMASYDFHHPGAKTEHPSDLIGGQNIDDVAAELDGCELLCSNCHREHHYRENNL